MSRIRGKDTMPEIGSVRRRIRKDGSGSQPRELARKLGELEHNRRLHGEDIQMILGALRQLEETSNWAYPEGRRPIGFYSKETKESGTKGKIKR